MLRYITILTLVVTFYSCKSSQSNNSQDDHKYTNNLVNESSPYLLQHANNPVDDLNLLLLQRKKLPLPLRNAQKINRTILSPPNNIKRSNSLEHINRFLKPILLILLQDIRKKDDHDI